ncbi:MAG: HAD hydrolase family protein [Planctomycetes bacterium]|nr:HAD hydrolase family protein [Planctomycetota bacterium]
MGKTGKQQVAEKKLSHSQLLKKAAAIRLLVLDFDGVMTDNAVYVFQDGREAVRCNRSDGLGIGMVRRAGVEVVVISTEANPVVSARCKKLNIECVQNCTDKLAALRSVAGRLGVAMEQTAFVGNDVNDLPCLVAVGLAAAVRDCLPDILPHVHYRTENPGGHGAVREICDLLRKSRPAANGKN